MKFGYLTEYNMSNIFPEKSYIKCGGEASPRLFCKKSKLSTSLDPKCLKCYKAYFLLYVEVEVYQNILKLMY